MSERLYSPGMDVTHAARKLLCQVVTRKMDVEKRGGRITMASELGDLVKLPPRSGQVCKAKMAKGMRRELWKVSLQSRLSDNLRPGPQGNGLGKVPG